MLLLRRLRLPHSLTLRNCRCGLPLDACGHHRAACARARVLGRRGYALESAAARICREAGGRVTTNVMVRDLDLAVPCASNTTKIPRKDLPIEEERMKFVAGEGKKTREILGLRGPHFFQVWPPTIRGLHPSGPFHSGFGGHPSGLHPSGAGSKGSPAPLPLVEGWLGQKTKHQFWPKSATQILAKVVN